MTTAHRPTFNSIIGSGSNPSGGQFVAHTTKVSNRDAAISTTLKYRKVSQGAPDERLSRKEFRETLEAKEDDARDERDGKKDERKKAREEAKQRREKLALENNPFPQDADDDVPSASDDDEEAGGDDEDDTEELMRELAKIKREREEEEQRQHAAQGKEEAKGRKAEVLKGNPLISGQFSGGDEDSLKRKWDDETVFKNQARTAPKQKQRYINDAVRSDFHRKFLQKYVWVDGVAH
mmetsp:Transcript_18044/g.40376  ORF Transcript_18044/g.40376 Transcript_18044/m.40376 type:complete len:236 (-) Transcript_18044:75-782(-)